MDPVLNSPEKPNIRLWMYTPNGTVWYPFCLVWSNIPCFRPESANSYKWPFHISGKITTIPKLFQEHLLQNENKHKVMNVHTKWNCLIPLLSCFRLENVSYNWPLHMCGKITTIPRNKHQVMNVHTKWNCLISTLPSLVK